MAITSMASLSAAIASTAQTRMFSKGTTTVAAQAWHSTWTIGTLPSAASSPTTAATCSSASAGALAFTNATIGTIRVVELCASSDLPRPYYLYDRLAHMGGLSGSTTLTQTVGVDVSSLTTRIGQSGYSEVEWWLEWYTSTGTTSVVATITYTNGAGTSGRTTNVTIPSSTISRRMIRIIGSNGEPIKSIQSIQHVSTGGTGNYGVTAMRCVTSATTTTTSTSCMIDWYELGLPSVPNDACLFFVVYTPTATSTLFEGAITFIDG